MLRVGLTGGIGSGKSTVAAMLEGRGALVVDADEIAREVVAPGAPAYEAVVARFGPAILAHDGRIDRPALARVAFADPEALADLNAITHPVIGAVLFERMTSLDGDGIGGGAGHGGVAGRSGVAVAVIPLLGPGYVEVLGLRAVVVVDCPTEVAIRRLVEGRGMAEADARARVAAQPSREERLALADYVVENSSSVQDLVARVEALWAWLYALRAHG
jgi:dephospho-CoA kinase